MPTASGHLFLGALPLSLGVSLISGVNIVLSIGMISMASSKDGVSIAGVHQDPETMLLGATWAGIGIVAAIFGGVGAVYEIPGHLTVYCVYLGLTIIYELWWALNLSVSGSFCGSVPKSVAPPGSTMAMQHNFVCGLTNVFAVFVLGTFVAVTGYATYVIFAAKQYITRQTATELLRYREPWERAAALAANIMGAEAGMSSAKAQLSQVVKRAAYETGDVASNVEWPAWPRGGMGAGQGLVPPSPVPAMAYGSIGGSVAGPAGPFPGDSYAQGPAPAMVPAVAAPPQAPPPMGMSFAANAPVAQQQVALQPPEAGPAIKDRMMQGSVLLPPPGQPGSVAFPQAIMPGSVFLNQGQ